MDILDYIKEFLGDYGAPLAIGSQALGTILQGKAVKAQNQANADVAQQQYAIRNKAAQERQRIADEQIAAQIESQKQKQAADQAARVAQQQRINAERIRQTTLREQADQVNANVVPKFAPQAQQEQQQSIARQIEDYITPTQSADEASYITGGPTAPKEIKERMEKTLAQSLAKGKAYAKGLATMSSFGGANQRNAITMADAGREIGTLGRTAQRSASVLPNELFGERAAGAYEGQLLDNAATASAVKANSAMTRATNQGNYDEQKLLGEAITRKPPGRGLAVGADLANGLGALSWLGAITRKPADPVASMWKAPTEANW